jgi:hypothetical protein
MAKAAQTGMSMHNLNLFPDDDISEDGEEGKDGGEGRLSIYDEEGNMVDLEAIGEVMNSGAALICMGDHDDLVASIYKLLFDRSASLAGA